jgi:hypothetical protein
VKLDLLQHVVAPTVLASDNGSARLIYAAGYQPRRNLCDRLVALQNGNLDAGGTAAPFHFVGSRLYLLSVQYYCFWYVHRGRVAQTQLVRSNVRWKRIPTPGAVQRETINGVPEEIWHYDAFSGSGRFVGFEGKVPRTGNKVDLEFLDECECNEYRLKTP